MALVCRRGAAFLFEQSSQFVRCRCCRALGHHSLEERKHLAFALLELQVLALAEGGLEALVHKLRGACLLHRWLRPIKRDVQRARRDAREIVRRRICHQCGCRFLSHRWWQRRLSTDRWRRRWRRWRLYWSKSRSWRKRLRWRSGRGRFALRGRSRSGRGGHRQDSLRVEVCDEFLRSFALLSARSRLDVG